MNFCPHCGAPLNGAAVCPKCGADASAYTPAPASLHDVASQPDAPTGKLSFLKKNIPQEKRKYVTAAFVVVMILCCALSLLTLRKRDVIHLADYVRIDAVTGMNGYGHLEYSFDSYSVYQKLTGADIKNDKDAEAFFSEENLSKADMVSAALEGVSVEADKCDGLSNGDKVTVTVSFKNPTGEKLDFELLGGEFTYTVEGLIEDMPFDPFSEEIISVAFTGASGSGEAIVGMVSDNELYDGVTYKFSDNHDLSNGDEVTLTAIFDQQYFASWGFTVPEQCSKTYTVSGLKDFFRPSDGLSATERTRFEDLTVSSTLDLAAKNVLTKDMSVLDSELWGLYYFETKTPGAPFHDMTYGFRAHCGIMGIAKVILDNPWDDEPCEDVFFVVFPDCMTGDDGQLAYDQDSFVVFDHAVSDEAEAMEWLGKKFDELTFTKLS